MVDDSMNLQYFKTISNFFVAGINYKKSDASIRGQFAISQEQYVAILDAAAAQGRAGAGSRTVATANHRKA